VEPALSDGPSPERALALLGLAVATRQRAGKNLLRQLEARHGPLEEWWRDRKARLEAEATTDLGAALSRPELDATAGRALEGLARAGFRAVEPESWPRLLTLPDPPAVLFQRGERRAAGPSLAVVGARRSTAYGLRVVDFLAGGVARRGVPILSGLARGIDAAAHRAALAAGGVTVAVLGSGPDRAYPPEHRELQDRIGREGVVLTEYLPGTPPLPPHFPRRNRILVALADAVLVVEARLKSGTLTSAAWAADLGREVLVVPGPIDSELSEGPVALLREGATPVGSVAHVLEALGIGPDEGGGGAATPAPEGGAPAAVTEAEDRLLALLSGGALDLDELIRVSGEAPSRVLAIVLSLETRGAVVRESDGRSFRRRARP
jgi:DNA processing protein